MKKATKQFVVAVLIFMLVKPASANESDDAVAASHETARAVAQQLLYNHVFSTLLGIMTNLPNYSSQGDEEKFKAQFNQIKARVFDLQTRTDTNLMTPVEDQVLADAQALLTSVDADYRQDLLNYNRVRLERNSEVANQADFSRNLSRLADSLAAVCEDGVAESFPITGFTNPQFAFPEFKFNVTIGSQNGESYVSGQTEGGTLFNPEGEAAFRVGTSYLATLFPIGTAVAVVMWAGYGLTQDEERRAEIHQKTEMLFHYYENAAHSEDTRRYYKDLCRPMLSIFKRTSTETDAIRLRQESADLLTRSQALAAQFKPVLDELQATSNSVLAAQKKAVDALPADATEDQKTAAARSAVANTTTLTLQNQMKTKLSGTNLASMIEFIFLSAAYKMRDSSLSSALIDQGEANEMLNQFSKKIYQLQTVSYRLHLLKQNPGLVAFFEKELAENKAVLSLYKRWVDLFAKALMSKVALTMDSDVRVSMAAFHEDLMKAVEDYPQSLVVQQMTEREKILQEVVK